MKVCFPIATDNGLSSELFSHFASAPLFLIVDSASGETSAVENYDPNAPGKGCDPFGALQGRPIDAIVVDAIGDAVHQTMNMCGFRVYSATSKNLQQLIEALKKEQLEEIEPFYSQDAGRCGDEEEGGCDHDEPEVETSGACVTTGGSGCANHGTTPCSHH